MPGKDWSSFWSLKGLFTPFKVPCDVTIQGVKFLDPTIQNMGFRKQIFLRRIPLMTRYQVVMMMLWMNFDVFFSPFIYGQDVGCWKWNQWWMSSTIAKFCFGLLFWFCLEQQAFFVAADNQKRFSKVNTIV